MLLPKHVRGSTLGIMIGLHLFPSCLTATFLEVSEHGGFRLKPHRLLPFIDQNTSLWKKASTYAEWCLATLQTGLFQDIQVLEVPSRNNVCKTWRRFRGEKEWGPKGQGDKRTHLMHSHKGNYLVTGHMAMWGRSQVSHYSKPGNRWDL